MSSLPIINKSYELYKQFTDVNDHMIKRWRLSLGTSIEESILTLLEQLVMTKNAPKPMKAAMLLKASGTLFESEWHFGGTYLENPPSS